MHSEEQKDLNNFLIACESDSKGRAGYEDKEFPQAKYFLDALEISKNIDLDLLKNKGLDGKKLGDALKKERIKALKEKITIKLKIYI